jgi:hypothetical protein
MTRYRWLLALPLLAALTGCPTPEVLLVPPESASMPPPVGRQIPLPAVAEPLAQQPYQYPDDPDAKP